MPIYKGSSEVTSGSLYKGSTEVQDGYKGSDPFYVNQNSITILFVDSVSGATLDTQQSFQTGVPGSSFTTIQRTLTVDSNRLITAASVSESGDTQGTVSASVTQSGIASRVVTVSGTFPTVSTIVTITVSGTTVQDKPNYIVSGNSGQTGTFYFNLSTENGGAIGSYNWTYTTTCPSGTNASGGGSSSSSSASVIMSGGDRGLDPACGSTCYTNLVVTSASGTYDPGSDPHYVVGSTPLLTPNCTVDGSNYNWGYNLNHNPGAPSSSPDGCNTIFLDQPGFSNITYFFQVSASNCAGSWPSNWSLNVYADYHMRRCTGATFTRNHGVVCVGSGSATGTINIVDQINTYGMGATVFNW